MLLGMRLRLSLVVLLVSAIAATTPLAYLDVPDEIWRGGIFDGNEDDAILHIQMSLDATEPAALYVAASPSPCVDLLRPVLGR